jgi:sulfide dehydrogenase cytochrome subunit
MNKSLTTLSLAMALVSAPAAMAADDAEVLSLSCNGCHGPEGVSAGVSIPSIAGLEFRYFLMTMKKFREGERASTIMERIAKGYRVSELRKISKYYAALKWGNTRAGIDAEKVLKGKVIHDELCEECHEKNGRHQDKDIPRISGQSPHYLYIQMLDYHAGLPTMPQPEKMQERIESLKLEELEALSHFYGSGG